MAKRTSVEVPRFGLGVSESRVSIPVVGPLSEWARLSCTCDRTTLARTDWWFAPIGDRYGVVGCRICKSLDVIDSWGANETSP